MREAWRIAATAQVPDGGQLVLGSVAGTGAVLPSA
jgi:hypothetical protein